MPGVDYDQTWAPASRLTSIRAIFAQAAMEGHFIESIDADNAYLNGIIEDQYEVYMEQAPGFEIKNPDPKGKRWVCRLKKCHELGLGVAREQRLELGLNV